MFRFSVRALQWQTSSRASGWATSVAAATAFTATPIPTVMGNQQYAPINALDHHHMTEFMRRASAIKKRWRGKGQYAFARAEAQRFLDSEVPKVNLGDWIEEGSNAIALSQLLSFFEIQPEASLASLILNKLIRTAEDESAPLLDRLHAALSLICTRPEENYERVFHVITQALQRLQQIAVDGRGSGGSSSHHSLRIDGAGRANDKNTPLSPAQMLPLDAVAVCAKVLQRCGRRTPPMLSEQLATVAMGLLQTTSATDLPYLQSILLRLYAWMVRAERPDANQLLFILIEKTGEFARYDFGTLMVSCARHHHIMHLPVELIQRLARVAFQYRNSFTGRDGAAILGTLARLVVSLTPGEKGVSAADVVRVQDYFNALLEEMQERVLRLFDPADALYWSSSEDMSSCAFAYELGGHLRYSRVFQAYAAYVQHSVQNFEPPQLALATGILRRAQLLTPHLATRLSQRIEVVLGELRLAELSHICATFAVLPSPRPGWWDEARAVALRLLQPGVNGLISINLAIAFPEQPDFAETVDYAQITSRQLVDLLPITLKSTQFGEAVVVTLCQRLASQGERFTPDDLRLLLACGERPQLVHAAQEHLHQAFAQPVWNTDTLYSLPLVIDASHPERNLQQFSASRALEAAKAASVGPAQFVSLAELLLGSFGDTDPSLREYVQTGGEDLLKEKGVSCSTIVRYLSILRRFPNMVPPTQWLHGYAEMLEAQTPRMSPDNLEDVLLSLRSLHEDVAKTPALQMVLSSLVRRFYDELADSEQTARITVLVVYLQRGMTLPLLTASNPTLQRVARNEAQYTPEVRRALAMMPTPTSVPAEERRGRFVLKHLEPARRGSEDTMPLLDLNLGDPFAEFLPTPGPATKPQSQPSVVSEPLSSSSNVPTTDAAAPVSEPEAVAEPPPPPPPPPPREEKPMSYYAKFFSSSVGHIFTGRGDRSHEETKKDEAPSEPAAPLNKEEPVQPEAPPPPEAPLQPRRTRLQPSSHATATAAAAAASTGAAHAVEQAPPHPHSAQQQSPLPPAISSPVPVTSFKTAWSRQPAGVSGANTNLTNPLTGNGWGFAAAAASKPTPATVESDHNSAFSSLFGRQPTPSPVAPSHTAMGAATPTHIAEPAAAPSSPVNRSGGLNSMSGKNIFFNPNDPSASRGRPVMSRKAVIMRPGLHGTASAMTGAAQGQAPSTAADSKHAFSSGAAEEASRGISADTPHNSHMSPPPNAPSRPRFVLNTVAASPADTRTAAATPNQSGSGKAGLMYRGHTTNTSAKKVYERSTREVAPAPSEPPVERASTGEQSSRQPIDWLDAARRVGRVTRLPRSKSKTRTQNSLSAWLNTPSARLSLSAKEEEAAEAEDEQPADTGSAAPGPGRQATVAEVLKGRRSKRQSNKRNLEVAAEDEAEEPETKRSGGGRGQGQGRAVGRAAKSTKVAGHAQQQGKVVAAAPQGKKKGGKASGASSPQSSSAKKGAVSKPAKTPAAAKGSGGSGSSGRVKRAAAPTATVKSAKKAVKTVAKKVTPPPAKKKTAKAKKK